MLTALYALAVALGAVLALLGEEPLWFLAVAALLVFPIAAGAASTGRPSPPAALAAALSGGLLVSLLIRLATLAPGWENATSADCGAASVSDQALVLSIAAVVFALAALPVIAGLIGIAVRTSGRGPSERPSRAPLYLYPLAVAASGLALIGASTATTC